MTVLYYSVIGSLLTQTPTTGTDVSCNFQHLSLVLDT